MATTASDILAAVDNPNVRKFRDMLAQAEGVKHGYATGFGNKPLDSLDDHPRTQSKFTQTDGKENTTSAAGRYQFLQKTWDGLRKQFPNEMPDFSEASQDFAATALLKNAGALKDIVNGDFTNGVKKVGAIWASLPSSPYKQNKRSWADISNYLGETVSGGGGGAPVTNSVSSKDQNRLFLAYKSGAMNEQQAADYLRDVEAGYLNMPKNAKVDNVKPAKKLAAAIMPDDLMIAYNDGTLSGKPRADFEADYKAGKIVAPEGITFALNKPVQQEAQPTTLLGDIGQGLGKLGSSIVGDGGAIDLITGLPKAAYGAAEAVGGGLAGMGQMAAKGIYGGASGLSSMLPQAIGGGGAGFGGFGAGFTQGAQAVENLLPLPPMATNAGQAIQQIMGAPSAELARGGQAVGQSVEGVTGSATLGGAAAAGFETLGNALGIIAPLKTRIAPEIAAAERTRQQIAANPPAERAAPVQPTVSPVAEQATPVRTPAERMDADIAAFQAERAPLAETPEGLAAQAETMAAPPVTPKIEEIATPIPEITRPDGKTYVLDDSLDLVHGSSKPDLSIDTLQITGRTDAKQSKRGRSFGGFYLTSKADEAQATGYANMGDGTPTLYDVRIKPDTKILEKTGDIMRLDDNYINQLVNDGYGLIVGKDVRGRTEYVVLDKNAVESFGARSEAPAVAPSEAISVESGRVAGVVPSAQVANEAKKIGTAYTASNKPIDFKYEVVPADSLVTSHDNSLNVNAAFPAELQPRDRTRAASDAQISNIQNKLNPARLTESPSVTDGAPVVGLDGVVESGNARTIAIRRGYGSGQSKVYKDYLTQNADRFGLNAAEIAAMPDPVLIRRRTSEVDRSEFAKDANVSNTAAMSAAERAINDSARLPDTDTLRIGEDGVVNLAANPDFVRGFIKAMPEAERGEMMNAAGELSQAGQSRIGAALTHKAYGDATMLERINENIGETGKRISSALVQKAPSLVAMADDVRQGALHENTVAADLTQAANKYADIKAAGGTIEDYLRQGQLVPDNLTTGAREALQVFGDNARSGRAIADYIQSKIEEVKQQGNPSQNTLFQADKTQHKAQVQTVRDSIADQVRATGKHSDEYAAAAGELAAAYYAATAKAIGKTVAETFDAIPLKITATKADLVRAKVDQARAAKSGATNNAKIILSDSGHEMVLGEKANASSFVHELGHHFLESSAKLAKDSPQLKADIDAVMEWGGEGGRSFDSLTASQKTALHEKFAETFEQYMLTGKAPTKKLAAAFERFKSWMADVYGSLKEFGKTNPDAQLSGAVTDVMDAWLGGKRKQTEVNQALESKREKGGEVPAILTDMKRSEPKTGGVSPSLWAARYNVLRNLGLKVEDILGGWVEGDAARIGQANELAKYDTAAGMETKQIFERSKEALREYADKIIKDTGGTVGAEAYKRGATIVDALQSYKDWYKAKTQEYYKLADEQAKNTAGIEMDGLNGLLRQGSLWQGIAARSQLRKGVTSYLREHDLVAKDGYIKPMSAKKAEGIRQYLNGQRTFDNQSLIGQLNAAIDESVINTLGGSIYKEARATYRQYNQVFNDPKGIAKILEHDEGNRTTAYDVVGKKITALAETNLDQFRHIKYQLQELPTKELQGKADAAIGEIRAQIAERITKADTPAAVGNAFESYRGSKLEEIFGRDLAGRLENYVAGVGILRKVDKQPSGTASQMRNNVDKYGSVISTVAGTATGGVFGGATGALLGTTASHLTSGKIKQIAFERIDAKDLKQALTFKQKEMMQKVYEAKARGVSDSPEIKAAQKALRELRDPTDAQVKGLSRKIEGSMAWRKFEPLLSEQQKSAIKKLGVIAWLSQTGQNEETK